MSKMLVFRVDSDIEVVIEHREVNKPSCFCQNCPMTHHIADMRKTYNHWLDYAKHPCLTESEQDKYSAVAQQIAFDINSGEVACLTCKRQPR